MIQNAMQAKKSRSLPEQSVFVSSIPSSMALPCHFCESLETAERLFNLFLSQPQLKTTLVFFSWIPNFHELSDHSAVSSKELILFIDLKLKTHLKSVIWILGKDKKHLNLAFTSLNTLIEKFCSNLCNWQAKFYLNTFDKIIVHDLSIIKLKRFLL